MADDADWQRDFPGYEFGQRDIVLAEYNSSAERARADEQAIAISNGLLVAALAPVIPAIYGFLDTLFSKTMPLGEALANLATVLLVLWFVTAILVRYLCQLRRSLVHAERKLIVLRRMLGLSYGGTTLVLPNWRLEGADNPMALSLFPGWSLSKSYAFFAAAFLSGASCFAAVHAALPALASALWEPAEADHLQQLSLSALFAFIWSVLVLWRTRVELMDLAETPALSIAKMACRVLNLGLEQRVATVLYKARLARYEAKRLDLNFNDLKRIAIFREDRRYAQHRGVSYRSIARALYRRARGTPAGGGSTIAQQLARTLFITDRHKTLRRKVVEIPLAYWLTKILSRDELIEVYLCSVRFDAHVSGVLAALRHFFDVGADGITLPKSVVLIERISNVRRKFRRPSVVHYLSGLLREGLISPTSLTEIGTAYKEILTRGLIETSEEEIDRAIHDAKNQLENTSSRQ